MILKTWNQELDSFSLLRKKKKISFLLFKEQASIIGTK